MKVLTQNRETYIYINGVKPTKEIILAKGLQWQPCFCKPTPDEIVSKTKGEIDIGVACLFLRSVSSQFKISADNPKELAFLAWNSSWDALSLGALFDCEVGFNFQSDVSAENFNNAREFRVSNYGLKGLQRRAPKTITLAEETWLLKNYSSFRKMMENDRFQSAVHCLATFRWHSMPRVQMAILWAGIEGLFEVDFEVSFRLSIYISRYLTPRSKTKRNLIYKMVKGLYSIRSKAVHGGKLKNAQDGLTDSIKILRDLIKRIAEKKTMPNQNELVP